MEITRYILPVVVGAMAGIILLTLGESAVYQFYPMPPGTDPKDQQALAAYMQTLAVGAYVLKLVNYALCSFLAGIICTLVSKGEQRPVLVIGIVMTLVGVYYVIKIPYPLWFDIAGLLTFIPCIYLGYMIAKKKARTLRF